MRGDRGTWQSGRKWVLAATATVLTAWAVTGVAQTGNRLANRPVLSAVAAAAKAAVTGERRVALVIGNGAYKYTTALNNPTNDAADMCRALKALGFETLCYENIRTKREMKDAVTRFTHRLQGGATALFYYAGHGLQVKGENFLVPVDAQLKTQADVEDETLNINYLMSQLDDAKNPFNIIILDACRNNPLARSFRSAGGGGLAPIDAPAGSVIMFATAPGREAHDGTGGRNGIFTQHLLANLERPGVTLEEMIKDVSRGVMDETGRRYGSTQTPWWNSSYTGRFCFAGCDDPRKAQEMARIQQEKEQLEAQVRRAQQESEERQRMLSERESRERQTQAALEARIKQLEADMRSAATKSSQQRETSAELVATRKQLDDIQQRNNELLRQETQLKKEREDLQRLMNKKEELDRQAAALEAANKRLAQLELEKAEKDKQLNLEREQRRSFETQQAPAKKPESSFVPPAF